MSDLIASSSATFLSTTGLTYANFIDWVGSILKFFLGTGLGLADAIKGWVAALIVISAILGLVYAAFRWFHILR